MISGYVRTVVYVRTAAIAGAKVMLLLCIALGCGDRDAREGAVPETPPPASASSDASKPPDSSGVSPEPQDSTSAAAAAALIASYYDAIASGAFRRAYLLWADSGGASGQSYEAFEAGFAQTEHVTADVGTPGRVEGAAGSRYVQVPVAVRARLTSGEAQCFRGSYTLRRSVVDGATPAQRRWHIASAEIAAVGSASCDAAAAADSAPASVTAIVERFGQALANVPLQAAEDVLRRAIQEHYGRLVTPSLLASWLEQPRDAPGRAVSSPWPDRIDVLRADPAGPNVYEVAGEVVEVTSVETASGGAAARRIVEIRVVRTDDGTFRIADYRQN